MDTFKIKSIITNNGNMGSSVQYILWGRENLWWFIDGSALQAGTIQKWTVAAPQTPLGISLKDSSEGKSLQWAKLQVAHLTAHFAWKDKWSEVWLYCKIHVLWNSLAGWALNWSTMNGKSMTRKWEEEVYDRLLWLGKITKISVFHVIAHQRVTSAEEDFNNQVARIRCSVDTSQPLSTGTPTFSHE